MKTKCINRFFLSSIFVFLSTFIPLSNAIATDLAVPQIAIENTSNKLKEKLQDGNFTNDFTTVTGFVEELINPHVDFNRISVWVLGKLWKKASNDEKIRFKKEFKTLLVRTYSRAFVEFKDWSVRFLPLKIKDDTKKVIVKTEILQPGIQPLAVNYRMVLSKGSWKVYDIMIEGVSLATNYRKSISNEYKKLGSLNAVIEKLAKRNSDALTKKDNS